ncbi:hypothetical protein EBU71_20525, partial [bacterium]|nr:hypothetical protein [Candidatus Elulimicrobium humile]
FTNEEIAYLNDKIASMMDEMVYNNDPERGRDDLQLWDYLDAKNNTNRPIANFDQNIINKVLSYFEEGYWVYHITFSDYNNNHINPNLPPHSDPNYLDTSLTFDYQLQADVDWQFCIDDECFSMNDNEAIIFDPKNSRHYRPELEFKTGESVKIVFFYVMKNNVK